MRVALYARYSSDRQNERSIADQLTLCRRHAEARGWTVVMTFEDAAISGSAMANRPGILNLLKAAEAGLFDKVLAEDEDRLSRSLEHLAHIAGRLDDAGVGLATLATDQVEEMHVAFKGLQASQYIKALSQKTRRGMTSNAEKGLATGSRLYGYASAPGGEMAIVEDQAAVVRRIFAGYAGGLTSRDIAIRLNREGVPGPRGGGWNASTIQGNAGRGNGILRTELYAGVKVWNRMEVVKNRQTGRRLPRLRPESEWKRTPVPALAIIDRPTWDQVQARLAGRRQGPPVSHVRRRNGVFSGLLKCGVCGSSYTVTGSAKRIACTGHREQGETRCGNRRTLARASVERQILDGLRDRLLTPEAVEAYVRIYHRRWAERAAQEARDLAPLERRLAELARAIKRIVDAVCDGTASKAMTARLAELEAEQDQLAEHLEVMRAQQAGPPPITLHPNAGGVFAETVRELRERLGEITKDSPESDLKLVDRVRSMVTRILLTPESDARAAPVRIEIEGDLARFLTPAEEDGEDMAVYSGSWGRDRTADLWVMNPPL